MSDRAATALPAVEDTDLLRRYAEEDSEAAFAELVRRRIGLVYSVALRHTHGDRHRAEDATQAVFTDLARKARQLARRPVLAGWLHRSAQFAATDLIRAEQRRHAREQQAHAMETILGSDPTPPDWDKVRPVLDEALSDLDERDRDAILLRFFDGRPFAEIGARLQLTENSARMRVQRALDKLHAALGRRGITSTTAALGIALSGHAAIAAPAGLAATVTGAALTSSVAAGGGFMAFMSMTKVQLAVTGALGAAGAVALIAQADTHAALRREIAALQVAPENIAALRSENQQLASTLAEIDLLRRDDSEFKRLEQDIAVARQAQAEVRRAAQQRITERDAQAEIDRMNREGNALVEQYKALAERARDGALTAAQRAQADADAKLKLAEIQAKQREAQAFIASVRAAVPNFQTPSSSLRLSKPGETSVPGRASSMPTGDTRAELRLPGVDHVSALSAYEAIARVKIIRDPSLSAIRGMLDLKTPAVSRDEALAALRGALRDQLNIELEPAGDGTFVARARGAR